MVRYREFDRVDRRYRGDVAVPTLPLHVRAIMHPHDKTIGCTSDVLHYAVLIFEENNGRKQTDYL